MALMPVWTGVSTDLRTMTPGAMRSTGRVFVGLDRALVVERLAERVDDAAEERLADRDLDDAAGRLDRVALLDRGGVAEDDRADGLLLEVEGHAHDAARELEQLGREGALEPVDLGDAVADLDDRADVARLGLGVERVDRGLDDVDDLVGADGHRGLLVSLGGWRALAGARHEALAQPLEAAPDAGVVEGVADADGEPADQRIRRPRPEGRRSGRSSRRPSARRAAVSSLGQRHRGRRERLDDAALLD